MKKYLATIAALAICLSMTACGDTAKEESSEK